MCVPSTYALVRGSGAHITTVLTLGLDLTPPPTQDSAGRLATGTRRVYVYAATPRAALGGWPTLLTGPGTGTDAPTPATESLPVTWADPGLPPATFRVLDLQIQDSGLGSGFPYGIVHGYLSARALSPDPAADPGDPDSWSLAT